MTAQSAIKRGQRQAVALMVEACVIKRRTGRTLDPATDKYVDTFDVKYADRCRVKPLTTASGVEAGQVVVESRRYVVSIPMSADVDIKRDDVVTVTESADAALVGRPLVVIDIALGELVTARRLTVEDRA